ncbi:MAG TPA: DUF6279 family lipoprotein [Steroidobacteraceae bacterium]|nr:DUF6279 family lipoprotein [Steroidobacteraceae bacterium]
MTAASLANNTQRLRARFARLVCMTLLALSVSACGTKLLYERFDRLAGWYLEGLVSLDADQRSSLDRWLEVSLEWHRASELNRYAAFLRELESELTRPLSYEDYDRARRRIEGFWRDFVAGTMPQAGDLLATLSRDQVDELIASLEEEDRETADELASRSASELAERRVKRLRRGVERWTGRLDGEQRRIVAEAAADLEPLGRLRLDNRAHWREQLRTALLAPPDVAAAAVAQLLGDPETTWTDAYRAGVIGNRDRVLRMMAELDDTLSDAQRARMRARIGELAEDLESLARE